MATGFKVPQLGGYTVDLDDIFLRRDVISQGALWTWGYNQRGQLGDGTIVPKSVPQTLASGAGNAWKIIDNGAQSVAAIKSDGTLWTWGYNFYGQLGDGTTVSKTSPIQTLAANSSWSQVACGYSHTMALEGNGTLWTWGSDTYGQLGDGTTTKRSSPAIVGNVNWMQIDAGLYHSAGVRVNNTLFLWGYNFYGQLGDGTTVNRSNYVSTVINGVDWKQVSCGGYFTASVKTDGTLWAWGDNTYGQLGDGSTVAKSSPVSVINGGNIWKQVSCGNYHMAAVKIDGSLWACGLNSVGQLGDGTTVDKLSVTMVTGGANWKSVSVGASHNGAIKSDGTFWTWGYNNVGQLGDGTTNNRSSPTNVLISGTANFAKISCGGAFTTVFTDLTFQ